MANIAQMVNVLQAMILTDKEKMILTPTYHVFKMYVPFQDATFVPVTFDAGTYTHGSIALPRVDALAARGQGRHALARPHEHRSEAPRGVRHSVHGNHGEGLGETVTGPAIDSVNTFEAPNTVSPKPITATIAGDRLLVTLAPRSVTVLAVRP